MSSAVWCFLGASGLVCVLRSSTPLRELSLRANDLGDPIASQVGTHEERQTCGQTQNYFRPM